MYTIFGIFISLAIWAYFAFYISYTVDFKKNVTFVDILLYSEAREHLFSVEAFLVLFFFAFSNKSRLFIMLTK